MTINDLVPKTLNFIKQDDYKNILLVLDDKKTSTIFPINNFKSIREMNDRMETLDAFISNTNLCYFVTIRNTNSKTPRLYYSISKDVDKLFELMPLDRYIYK